MVKKVKILDLMQVLLAQMALGVQYIDIQVIDEETLRITPSKKDVDIKPDTDTDTDLNQTIA